MQPNEPDVLPCHEKLAFETKKAATTAATVSDHYYGNKLMPYLCRHCGLWHLATKYDD